MGMISSKIKEIDGMVWGNGHQRRAEECTRRPQNTLETHGIEPRVTTMYRDHPTKNKNLHPKSGQSEPGPVNRVKKNWRLRRRFTGNTVGGLAARYIRVGDIDTWFGTRRSVW